MRVVTWNVNSIRARLPRVEALLRRHEPDVLCLQETKVGDAGFPFDRLASLGYRSASFGQPTYNGVAMVSGTLLEEVELGFPGDPVPGESRVMSGVAGGLTVVNVYAVNGKAVGTQSYEIKLAWFDALAQWLAASFDPDDALLVVGDFNVAPEDRDVHDPMLWRGRNLASEPERDRVRGMLRWGLVDLQRLFAPGPGEFTFWDYRAGSFHRGWGLRLDLALATPRVAERCRAVTVDRDERKPSTGEGKPSDHAPVIVDLDGSAF